MFVPHASEIFSKSYGLTPTTWNFELFAKKPGFLKSIFDKASESIDTILEDVSVAETIVNAKLLILWLPSFSVPKIMVVRHV